MKRIFIFITFIFSLMCLDARNIVIDTSKKYQIIDGFGASDCWTVHYVGKYWSLTEKEKAAEYLFSRDFDKDGNPKGIGLSIWRFNIGGGTIEQGDSSNLNTDITRRAECFIDKEGHYNWDKQIGQQWFLSKAAEYGCNSFVAFSNTPPVYMTRNGKGYAPKDGNSNLQHDKYDEFADFLVNVINGLEKKYNIRFDYISPVNEPQWDWSATYQEGCPWQNKEIKRIVESLDKAIRNKRLDCKILITEAGAWDNLYELRNRASNQIYEFFDKNSSNYIGDIKTLQKEICGHSYWTDTNHKQIKDVRQKAYNEAKKYGLKLIQSEWSMLNKTPLEGFPESYNKATYMDIALFMSKIIYADLVYANVSSWSFWTSMDIELWGFKNRFNLLRLHTPKNDVNSIVDGGYVSSVKTLWALGNFSRFVKPGYVRVDMSGCDDLGGIMGTSYISPETNELVSVYINMDKERCKLNVSSDVMSSVYECKYYVTDENNDLSCKVITKDNISVVNLNPKSVTTIVYKLK